jgi:hypothetical protein
MTEEPDARQQLNRLIGLSSYAGGVILLGIIGLGIYDGDRDYQTFAIIAVAALACFGLGYTTSQKTKT